MFVTPFQFFDQIEFPDDFSEDGVRRCIDENIYRVYFGAMSRSDFELAVFQMDIDAWPLGHLQDHRVSLPKSIAEKPSSAQKTELVRLLRLFLAVRDVGGASNFVGDALKLNPERDADSLLQIHASSPETFVALLVGDFRGARNRSKGSGILRRDLEDMLCKMLLYYGALELQLIAARHRAVEHFGFGVAHRKGGPAIGGLIGGWEKLFNPINFAAHTVETGTSPAGKRHSLFKLLKEKAEKIEQSCDASSEEMLEALSKILNGIMMPIITDQVEPSIEEWRSAPRSGKQPTGSAMRIPTLIDDQTVAQQLAFASLRLESLMENAHLLLENKPSLESFEAFNSVEFRAGGDGPSLRLYFVCQSVIIEDRNSVLGERSVSDRFSDYGQKEFAKKANTTIKAIRGMKGKASCNREPVSPCPNEPPYGLQRYDILPDYRLGIKPTLSAGTASPRKPKKGHDLPEHTRKHGQTRMARKQVRHYKASIKS